MNNNLKDPQKKGQSAKIRLEKPRNSRENDMPPFNKPRKRANPSRYIGGKNSPHFENTAKKSSVGSHGHGIPHIEVEELLRSAKDTKEHLLLIPG